MKIATAAKKAVASTGFLKAMGYSFGSWVCVWLLAWLASSEAMEWLGAYGWMIPLFNTIVVFFKQSFDELEK